MQKQEDFQTLRSLCDTLYSGDKNKANSIPLP
jgi:hypothetical protein